MGSEHLHPDPPEHSRALANVRADCSKPAQVATEERTRATPSDPFDHLPPEILEVIFEHCVAVDPDVVVTLCAVSHRWQDVVISSPRLWQHVILKDTANLRSLREKADIWTNKSLTRPLDFTVHFQNIGSLLPILSYLFPAANRWGTGTFTGIHRASRLFFSFRDPSIKPSLDMLSISIADPQNFVLMAAIEDMEPEESDELFREVSTMVQQFDGIEGQLSGVYINVACLPRPEDMTPMSALTTLVITVFDQDMSIHSVTSFLSVCPNLEALRLEARPSLDPESVNSCINIPMVSLPNLRELKLTAIFDTRCFLSHIISPVLQKLSFVRTNSTAPYVPHAYSEPGDSDDEAHDFSQSPTTDHATGMGLRSLFSRCNPPLRILILDYADLRTKDFKWAFENMRDLRELRVVASDMSDKVMCALSLSGTSECIPLPCLETLDLKWCQRMSGDALESMIHSRIKAAQAGLITPLQGLKITCCKGFSAEHHRNVARIFRPRSGLTYVPY